MPERDDALILLAEDRDDDVLLVLRALQKANIRNPVQVVRDGEEAIQYLAGEGKYSNRSEYPLPDLVLLDLKMPKIDGFGVLSWVRQQPGLKCLRIVVLTSSDQIRDVNRAYEQGANSFLVKPLDFAHFIELSAFVNDYWLRLDRAPLAARMSDGPKSVPDPSAQGTKVFIYDPRSERYYVGFQSWSHQRHSALDLETIERAESLSKIEHIIGMELILVTHHPASEIRLPLMSARV